MIIKIHEIYDIMWNMSVLFGRILVPGKNQFVVLDIQLCRIVVHCSKYLKEHTVFSHIHNGTHAGSRTVAFSIS